MATSSLEELDQGLGAVPGLDETSGWPYAPQERMAAEGGPAGTDAAGPSKRTKEPEDKAAPAPGKGRPRPGAAAPRSPARRKTQAPPPQGSLKSPPGAWDELPWGPPSLGQCLVLASLLALLGSAGQLCRDALFKETGASEPVPAPPPTPPRPAPKEPSPLPAAPAPPPAETSEQLAKTWEAEEELGAAPPQQRGPQDRPGRAPREQRGPQDKPRKHRLRREEQGEEEEEEERPPRKGRPRRARRPGAQGLGEPATPSRRRPGSQAPAPRAPKRRAGRRQD